MSSPGSHSPNTEISPQTNGSPLDPLSFEALFPQSEPTERRQPWKELVKVEDEVDELKYIRSDLRLLGDRVNAHDG
jgi:hypothetical protein